MRIGGRSNPQRSVQPALYNGNVATAVASRAPTRPSRLSLPEAWHLLSLDAPTVAALWAYLFARAANLQLPWHSPAILALGTWLLYVADRILDGFRPAPTARLQARHHFHRQHRAAFLVAAVVAGATLLWLILTRMSPIARREDTVLFLIALLYFFLVHQPLGGAKRWLPKELAVGIVFAAATAVPAWSRLGGGKAALLPAVATFAALCSLNCVAIERWENPPLQPPFANITTRWVANHFRPVCLSLAAIGGLLATISALPLHGTTSIYLAALVSALILARIDHRRQRLSPMQLRIAADAVLLTPIFFLTFLRG